MAFKMRRTDLILIPALVPLGLLLSLVFEGTVLGGEPLSLETFALWMANALHMGAPHLVFGALALWRTSLRRHASPVLWCLSLFLVEP
jgi:hypothetical protein